MPRTTKETENGKTRNTGLKRKRSSKSDSLSGDKNGNPEIGPSKASEDCSEYDPEIENAKPRPRKPRQRKESSLASKPTAKKGVISFENGSSKPSRKTKKTKKQLNREGVTARSSVKALTKEKKELENLLEQARHDLDTYQRKFGDLEKEKNDAANKEKGSWIDDEAIRRDIADIFTDCHDWTATYARTDAMIDFLTETEIAEMCRVALGLQEVFRSCFLREEAMSVIGYVRGGGRFFVEAFLANTVVDQILRKPLLAFDQVFKLGESGASLGQVLEKTTQAIATELPAEARLMHAHMARVLGSLRTEEEECSSDNEGEPFDSVDERLIDDWIFPMCGSLLRPDFPANEQDALEGLHEILRQARQVSCQIWSQDVFIDIWGDRKEAFAHCHSPDDNIKCHTAMKLPIGDTSQYGERFDMFISPMIGCHNIKGMPVRKVWCKAVGMIFKEKEWRLKRSEHSKGQSNTDKQECGKNSDTQHMMFNLAIPVSAEMAAREVDQVDEGKARKTKRAVDLTFMARADIPLDSRENFVSNADQSFGPDKLYSVLVPHETNHSPPGRPTAAEKHTSPPRKLAIFDDQEVGRDFETALAESGAQCNSPVGDSMDMDEGQGETRNQYSEVVNNSPYDPIDLTVSPDVVIKAAAAATEDRHGEGDEEEAVLKPATCDPGSGTTNEFHEGSISKWV